VFFSRLVPTPRHRHNNNYARGSQTSWISLGRNFCYYYLLPTSLLGGLKPALVFLALAAPLAHLQTRKTVTRPLAAHLAPVLYFTSRSSTGIAFVTGWKGQRGRRVQGFFHFFRSPSPSSSYLPPLTHQVAEPHLNLLMFMLAYFLLAHVRTLYIMYDVHNKYMPSESGTQFFSTIYALKTKYLL